MLGVWAVDQATPLGANQEKERAADILGNASIDLLRGIVSRFLK